MNIYFLSFFSSDLSTLANVVTTLATMGKKDSPTYKMENNSGDSVAKAFDTMAKAAVSQGSNSATKVGCIKQREILSF